MRSQAAMLTLFSPQKPKVVSLWGLFDPNDRIKYYPNSYPLTAFDVCPHAPCRDHNFQLPLDYCADAKNVLKPLERNHYCPVLEAITPDMVLRKVDEVLCGTAEELASS
ncbi:unnamed protein product [marine sediment metagenome]|uniref:Uncharacterized protein n=1 Tax=marine sediment metagenome TaxID=412755 RepID=X1A027_9ZZZZ